MKKDMSGCLFTLFLNMVNAIVGICWILTQALIEIKESLIFLNLSIIDVFQTALIRRENVCLPLDELQVRLQLSR